MDRPNYEPLSILKYFRKSIIIIQKDPTKSCMAVPLKTGSCMVDEDVVLLPVGPGVQPHGQQGEADHEEGGPLRGQ